MTKINVLLGLGLFCMAAAGCKPKPPPPAPPPQVRVVTISPTNVPIYQEWIGTLDGYPNAQIRAQVTGYLIRQNYAEGSRVKKGDLLFEIDPRPFKAALDQALARQAQDEAQSHKTELDVQRYTPLAKTQAVSQEVLVNAIQANLSARATVEADKAAVETARLNLEWTKVTSPVTGIAGVAQAQIGDLVGPAGNVLTTVSTINPIRAYYNISEQFYLQYRQQHPNESNPENDIALELILSDGSVYPRSGKWLFTGRQVDVNTGTLQAAGQFDNPDNILRPGGYALIRAKTETLKGALVVPQKAVNELQGTYQVGIVDQENKAHIKTVQAGKQIGNDWIIDSGLQPGDRVIAEGLQKVKDGMTVEPESTLPLPAKTAAGG